MERDPKFLIDPMEKILRDGLDAANIAYVEEEDARALGLDFFLPEYDLHVEVKQYHSERITKQMKRVDDIIVIQGKRAARIFVALLKTQKAHHKDGLKG